MPSSFLVFSQRPRRYKEVGIVLLNLNLYFLGNRGVINVAGVVWGPQHLCHYAAHTLGPVFSVLNATIASVYESCISKAAASTSKG